MSRGKPKPQRSDGRWLVPDARPGTQFLTSAGMFVNGSIAKAAVVDALRKMGFAPVALTEELPAPEVSEEERADIQAANKMLGVETLESGKTQIQADCDRQMRRFTTKSGIRRLFSSSF